MAVVRTTQQRQLNSERQEVLHRKNSLDEQLKSNIDNRARFTASLNSAQTE